MNRSVFLAAFAPLLAVSPACKCGGSPADKPAAKPAAPAAKAEAKAEAPAPAAKAPAALPGYGAANPGPKPPITVKAAEMGEPKPAPGALPKKPEVGDAAVSATAAASGGAYAVVPDMPRDTASVEGRVMWSKDLPAPSSHKVPDDLKPACGPTQDRRAVARGPQNGVEGAIVRLTGVAQGKAFVSLPGLDPQVTVAACRATPRALVMQAGGKLKISNSDAVDHTFKALRDGKELFRVTVKAGQVAEQVIKGAGFVELVGDKGREWMRTFIHAGSHPYAQVTNRMGSFRIASVLPGAPGLEVWHPPVEPGGKPLVQARQLGIDKWLTATADFDLAP